MIFNNRIHNIRVDSFNKSVRQTIEDDEYIIEEFISNKGYISDLFEQIRPIGSFKKEKIQDN
jgi:hypothetical protein